MNENEQTMMMTHMLHPHISSFGDSFESSFFLQRKLSKKFMASNILRTGENGLKADDDIKTTIGSEHFVKDSHQCIIIERDL